MSAKQYWRKLEQCSELIVSQTAFRAGEILGRTSSTVMLVFFALDEALLGNKESHCSKHLVATAARVGRGR